MLGAVVERKGFIRCDQGVLSYSVIGMRSSGVLLQSEVKIDNCIMVYI